MYRWQPLKKVPDWLRRMRKFGDLRHKVLDFVSCAIEGGLTKNEIDACINKMLQESVYLDKNRQGLKQEANEHYHYLINSKGI